MAYNKINKFRKGINYMYSLFKKNNRINVIGENSKQKKKIIHKLDKIYDHELIYLNINENLSKKAYFLPVVLFLKNYFMINSNDKAKNIKNKIEQKLKICLSEEFFEKLFKILYYFSNFKLSDIYKLNRGDLNSIHKELYYYLFQLMDYLKKYKKYIIIADNYNMYDKWSKKFIKNYFLDKNKKNLKLILFTENKIENKNIDKTVIINPEKSKIEEIDISESLKIFSIYGNSISLKYLKKFMLKENYSENKILKELDNLKKYDFIYESNGQLYFLNNNIKNNILIRTKQEKKRKIAWYHYQNYYENKKNKSLYDYIFVIYWLKIIDERNLIKKELQNVIDYFETIKSADHLIEYYRLMCNYETDKDQIFQIKLRLIHLFKNTGKYREGLKFINNLDTSIMQPRHKNTINSYYYYFKRIIGHEIWFLKELKKGAGIALENKWYKNYFFWNSEIAFLYYLEGKYKKGFKFLEKNEKYIEKVDERTLIGCYYSLLAMFYEKKAKFKKAKENYEYAIKLARKHNACVEEITQLNNYAAMYLIKGEFDKAINIFQRANQVSDKLGSKDKKLILSLNIGYCLLRKLRINESKEYIDKALRYAKITGNKRYTSMGYFLLSKYYFHKGKFMDALLYLTSVEEIAKEKKYKSILSDVYMTYGEIYFYKKRYKKAKEYLIKGINLAEEVSNSERFYYILYLINIYKNNDNYNKIKKIIDESLEKSKKINDNYFYRIKALKLLIFDKTETDTEKKLKQILINFSNDNLKMDIYYDLWKMKRKKEYKEKLKNYFKGIDSFIYQNRYRLLNTQKEN